jgi:hypothetical protein
VGISAGIGPLIIWAVLSALIWVGIPVGIFVFARRFLRAVERRSIHESQFAELAERLQRLEARLDDLADDTERLREDQRFTRQLLAEPAAHGRGSSPGAA